MQETPVNFKFCVKTVFLSSDELHRWLQWVPLKKRWEAEAPNPPASATYEVPVQNWILQIFLATTRKLWGSYTFKLWELLLSNEYVICIFYDPFHCPYFLQLTDFLEWAATLRSQVATGKKVNFVPYLSCVVPGLHALIQPWV